MAEPEPDCSALLDEELSSFVFNYLSDSQYEVSGEEHLYSDFPEIDLSPLDTSDFDSANCFSEFQWWCEHSETESSQYSTDDSELFQIIDSENEALLAALTETLDDIQEEDMGLAAFKNMDEGDMPNSGYTSPIPSPNPAAPVTRGPPVAQEVDELSLLKKLLLSPSNVPPSYEVQKEGNIWHQGPPKSRPQRSCAKVEGVHDRKSTFSQAQSRNCTELHKHLTTTTTTRHCPHRKNSGPLDKCHADNISTCSLPQRHYIQNEEDSNLNKDALNCGNSVAPPLSSSEKGTGDKELHAAVELIHYMHTYCLPPRKLPPMHPGEGKHQPFHSPSKRAKPDPPLQQPRLCGNDNCPSSPWHFSMHCKQSRTPLSEFSILKELLARELPCDVSKPYRLAKPVYSSLARSQLHKSSRTSPHNTGRESTDGYNKPATKIIPEMKTELRQILKVEPEAEKETAEEDGAKQGTPMGQGSYGKSSRKPDTSIYAVRRSKRLNPELSLWQSFLDKPPSEPTVSSATTANAFASIEPALCSSLQNFDTEAPAAEVEVSGADEMDGGFQSFPMELQTPSPESSRESDTYAANESQCFTPCHQTEAPRCLSLPLAQTESTLGKRSFDQVLTVELCGTAGLTPPTTPPYKPSEEDLYKPDIHQRPAQKTAVITSSEPQPMISHRPISRKHQKKQPVRTELYAHLSRSAIRPAHSEQHGVLKRPFSRSFGDHDYCQVLKPEYSLQRKVLRSWEPLSHIESQHKRQVPDVPYQEESNKSFDKISVKEGSKQLRDQEIRASLTKHFGLLDSALDDGEEALFFKTPEYDTVFEDSCSEIGSPLEEEEEEEEEEEYYMSPLGSNRCLHSSALSRTNLHYCSRNRSDSESSCCRSRSPVNQQVFRRENGKRCQEGNMTSQRLMEKKREKAIGEGRVVYIQNLASSMSSSELKKQFEVFGEIVECCILTKNKRGDKYGVITYRCSEHAALSLKNGASLWKRNEPLFQLAYGGFGHFFWTRFTDLADSNTEESSPTPVKSKYETMDFDSLLQEAQESLHR